ncbi:MAG: hypothetical protein J0L93_05180 [Deltaproteobacteria bacterium]|nr:hypothetical protein [Deltaproteobacteria bacterium]
MKLALVLGLLGATSVSAAPYYVGENLKQNNAINLGFLDAPTKKEVGTTGKAGNVAAFNLNGAYSMTNNSNVRIAFPFYMVSKNATASATSKNAIGNLSIGAGWTDSFQSANRVWNYGYSLTADIYAPTSRKAEGFSVARINPTTDLYRFATKATSVTPTAGIFVGRDTFSAKTNIGLGMMYLSKSSVSGTSQTADGQTKAARYLVNWQTAASWHALQNLNANIEYNTVYLDSKTAMDGGTTKRAQFRSSITPSLSGNYEQILASAYVTLPIDAATRDRTAVAFGVNAGYSF